MTDWLSMNAEGVRQQADSFRSAASELTAVAGSWGNMLAAGDTYTAGDLGFEYAAEGQALATGFGHLAAVVHKWAAACSAFENALRYSADTVQSSDQRFAGEIAAVGFDDAGGLTIDGK
ncbi:hypothetical protein D7D52_23780 [Nocardia yunnanensis]|uniref:ESX-1 secretion-associated protein n=1 Tax=Nocardia yunnanensis TaxID=2382165 RepID=A0A386ZFY4_9NOCA|nr:hypothetical protein [Nocardia yunnanensis]AYF76346.1 hypothetical protein D7D52_23780 [Nocardia yunnanensis]